MNRNLQRALLALVLVGAIALAFLYRDRIDATLGAALAFLVARYLASNWVQARALQTPLSHMCS